MADAEVFLLAAGGHGSVVLDTLLAMGVPVHGIVDPAREPGGNLFGVAVLGGDEWLERRGPAGTLIANGAGARPHAALRRKLYERFASRGFAFCSVRHPSAVIGRDAALAAGSQVLAGAVLQCRVALGPNSVVNTRASVDHDCIVGSHVFIGPGAVLCGEVRVGDDAFIGAGAVLMPGVEVGAGAIVGAGAVVHRAVAPGVLVTGIPASARKEKQQ